MEHSTTRNLPLVSLTSLLVSAHYGLGFILGTAEQSLQVGAAGSLYAVAVGLGMMALGGLAPFYWRRVELLWTILGDRYGTAVKIGIGVMSWIALIGIEAAQILSAVAILAVLGFPALPTMLGLTLLFCGLSLIPVERVSWVVRVLLLLNVLVLIAALWRLDQGTGYAQAVLDFPASVAAIEFPDVLGVLLSTVLLVMVDSKCQQYVVRSRSVAIARWSCVLAGGLLVLLAFLPSAVVTAAAQSGILPDALSGKATIPYILSWLGGGADQRLGQLCVAALALPALGIGSTILRVQTRTNLDIAQLPADSPYRFGFAALNAALALAIALRGGEIVGLILSFYAAYLAAVWVPLVAYLLEQGEYLSCSTTAVQFSLGMGAIAALVALALSLFYPETAWLGNAELSILVTGVGFSGISLLGVQAIEQRRPTAQEDPDL